MDLYGGEVVVEDVRSGEGRAGQKAAEFVLLVRAHQFDVDSLSQVLHGLTEDGVVHQFVEILLEGAGGLLPQLGVHPNVGLHPGALLEAQGAVYLFQLHPESQVKLEVAVVEHVVVLVAEVGDQLFDLGGRHTFAQEAMLVIRHPLFLDHHALWGERVGVVAVV